jgi:hypothetical protein
MGKKRWLYTDIMVIGGSKKMYTKEEIKNVLLHFNTTASSKDVIDLLEFLY